MNTTIPYGKSTFQLDLPDDTVIINTKEVTKGISKESFTTLVETYLEKNSFDLSNPTIVVADKTRLCGYPEYLPLLISALIKFGADRKKIKFIIAYGTHPAQSEEECISAYGEIYDDYPFIHHSSSDITLFKELGKTKMGTPVRVRRDLLESSCVITMGAICHHYFAGYGGGRKLLFPGCGETTSIYANHSLFLDSNSRQLSTNCQPGNFSNNPIAEDLFEFENFFSADFSIHGLMDQQGKLYDALIGSDRQTFLDACDAHGSIFEVVSDQYEHVLVSCGGFPKDINLIQAHKAIHNGAMFVKDGGHLIVFCECIDQIGSKTLLPWFEFESFESSFDQLQKNYQGNGGTALSIMTKTKRITISLVTSLSADVCKRLGVNKLDHKALANLPATPNISLAYIPNGSLTTYKKDT